MKPYRALLLVGPTGSGKTPLGAFCEKKGLWNQKVFHFDFGAILRQIAGTGQNPYHLAEQDIKVIRHSLATGALLENENFHIAKKIILSFTGEKQMRPNDLLLLNGFPRHVGQAKGIDVIMNIKLVLALESSPGVVFARIQKNSGGDRVERIDDSLSAIENKLKIFSHRTVSLLSYYQQQGVSINRYQIKIDTTPREIHHRLNTTISIA